MEIETSTPKRSLAGEELFRAYANDIAQQERRELRELYARLHPGHQLEEDIQIAQTGVEVLALIIQLVRFKHELLWELREGITRAARQNPKAWVSVGNALTRRSQAEVRGKARKNQRAEEVVIEYERMKNGYGKSVTRKLGDQLGGLYERISSTEYNEDRTQLMKANQEWAALPERPLTNADLKLLHRAARKVHPHLVKPRKKPKTT